MEYEGRLNCCEQQNILTFCEGTLSPNICHKGLKAETKLLKSELQQPDSILTIYDFNCHLIVYTHRSCWCPYAEYCLK